ncbi:uncharacterized protein BKCO1_2800075 [Diplodia corticola]|uniref:Uncharacterized protein n=1 Tax=Diplodia corticola TaxID=236234 RepID=A0A1J9S1X4_9PEZI|nr:uncharacterized protein BKCO1_2800075 [Diplodia corticola]OJD33653.1 hypothetical protein BKCO1_2800075 [Diplodia corticola]
MLLLLLLLLQPSLPLSPSLEKSSKQRTSSSPPPHLPPSAFSHTTPTITTPYINAVRAASQHPADAPASSSSALASLSPSPSFLTAVTAAAAAATTTLITSSTNPAMTPTRAVAPATAPHALATMEAEKGARMVAW